MKIHEQLWDIRHSAGPSNPLSVWQDVVVFIHYKSGVNHVVATLAKDPPTRERQGGPKGRRPLLDSLSFAVETILGNAYNLHTSELVWADLHAQVTRHLRSFGDEVLAA